MVDKVDALLHDNVLHRNDSLTRVWAFYVQDTIPHAPALPKHEITVICSSLPIPIGLRSDALCPGNGGEARAVCAPAGSEYYLRKIPGSHYLLPLQAIQLH